MILFTCPKCGAGEPLLNVDRKDYPLLSQAIRQPCIRCGTVGVFDGVSWTLPPVAHVSSKPPRVIYPPGYDKAITPHVTGETDTTVTPGGQAASVEAL